MSTILIKKALIIDPNSNYKNLKQDILIVDGIIVGIENIKEDHAGIKKIIFMFVLDFLIFL